MKSHSAPAGVLPVAKFRIFPSQICELTILKSFTFFNLTVFLFYRLVSYFGYEKDGDSLTSFLRS
jgi:hypothetical protein